MKGFDIDGVITQGYIPGCDDIIITGRSIIEEGATLSYLESLGITNKVYFSPSDILEKTHISSGNHKAEIINTLGVTVFYEDELLQAEIIKNKCPNCTVILVEKKSKFLLEDALRVQEEYYLGRIGKSKVNSNFLYHVYNHPDAPIFMPKDDYEIVILMSGGIDSFVAYHYAKSKFNNVKAVYVDYGYPYARVEKETILNLGIDNLEPFVDFSYLSKIQEKGESKWGEIFPGRNWILSIIASDFIKKRGQIWMAAIGGEVKELWGDKSHFFFNRGSEILSSYTGKDIIITSPFKELTKGELIHWYIEHGLPIDKLKNTVSCHYIENIGDKGCGQCMGCAHRYIGMKFNGIEEEYKNNIHEFAKTLYLKELVNPFTQFSPQRLLEIKTVLNDFK